MKSYSLKLKALMFVAGLVFVPSQCVAQTVVTSTANGGIGTLRDAVINSNAGDTITFSPTLLANGSDTITLTSDIILYHGLVFQGINNATDTLYIYGNKQTRLFYLSMGNMTNKNVVFENMAFINGKPMVANPSGPEHGGAIWAVGVDTLTIDNCVFRGNETYNNGRGGAVYGLSFHFNAQNSILDGNKANGTYPIGGAVYVEEGSIQINQCEFKNNEAKSKGGAISCYKSKITCTNSRFIENFVNGPSAGAVYAWSEEAHFSKCVFLRNSSDIVGSAFLIYNADTLNTLPHSVVDCIVESNSLNIGGQGAVYVENTMMNNTVIKNNTSNDDCAGLFARDSRIVGSSIINNTASRGRAAMTITNCIIRNTTISGNTSLNGSLTILLSGQTIFKNVTVTDNSQDDEAIGSGDTLVISNSIVSGNGQFWYEDGIDVSTLISGGYNIIRNNPTGTVSTDLTNYNGPLNLEPLGMYGGTTPTMPPLTTSAAYNAGDSTKFQNAQNGPIYGRRDIGAAEHRHLITDTTLGCGSVTFWGTTYNTPGTFYDTVSNANSLDSVGILVLTGLDTAVVNNNGVLIAQDTNTATTFQWVDCDKGFAPVTGATSSTFVPTQNGTYALILTNGNCTDTSSCYPYNEVGVEEHTKQSLHFYPNPASHRLTIVTHGPLPSRMQIVDIFGRLINSIEVENSVVNLPPLNGGVYLLRWVYRDGTIQVDRVVIH